MRFLLYIDIGNDAVQTPHDLASLLDHISNEVDWHVRVGKGDQIAPCDAKKILDGNGNTVGEWKIKEEKGKTKIGRP